MDIVFAVYSRCVKFFYFTVIILTFITQQSTPVLLAVTMPWDITGPMHTAWVGQTLIAELTLPAIVTPEKHKNRAMTDDKTNLQFLANALRQSGVSRHTI